MSVIGRMAKMATQRKLVFLFARQIPEDIILKPQDFNVMFKSCEWNMSPCNESLVSMVNLKREKPYNSIFAFSIIYHLRWHKSLKSILVQDKHSLIIHSKSYGCL